MYWSCRISAVDGSCHMFMFEATGKKDEPLDPHWQVDLRTPRLLAQFFNKLLANGYPMENQTW